MQKREIGLIIFSVFFLSFFSSCASLPKATVDMSIMLDKQLMVLERNHTAIIDKYFEEKQSQALSILDNDWYPNYLNHFFNDAGVEDIWNEMIENSDMEERISDLQGIVSIIQEEYMRMRDSLILPLESTRRELLTAVHEEYSVARTMNNAVLNNVASVNDIQELRREYLSKFVDVNSIENSIDAYFERAGKILENVQKGIETYNEAEPRVKSIIDKLNL